MASFILDISAVADAPILRPGSDLLANIGDYLEVTTKVLSMMQDKVGDGAVDLKVPILLRSFR